jgi:hypothetical protein
MLEWELAQWGKTKREASAAHLPTASQDFQRQHKKVVDALESVLPGVCTAENFTNQDKDTMTGRIKAHGNTTLFAG